MPRPTISVGKRLLRLVLVGGRNFQDLLHARILDHRCEFRVFLRGPEFLIAVIAGKLQVMSRVFRIASLGVEFRQKEGEQSGIGSGPRLKDGTNAALASKNI